MQLVNDFWTLLKGEERGGVAWEALRITMLNMIGVKTPENEKTPEGEEEQPESPEKDGDEAAERPSVPPKEHHPIDVSKLGFYEGEDGIFHLRKGDHKKLFTHFKNFYVHRVQYIGS